MKRKTFMLLPAVMVLAGFLLIPFNPGYVAASSSGGHGSQDEHAAKSGHGGGHSDEYPGEVPFDRPLKEVVKELAPMNELELFPCSDCHDEDWETTFKKRGLDEPHDEIPGKFINHDADNRWCLDCHSAKYRDRLRLINNKLIRFNEYYRICEQCHRRTYREWKVGVHGKRTGHWDGKKEHMHCAQCHDPHNPPFKAMKPMPVPRKPLDIKKSAKHSKSSSNNKH